ncbi:hypothetical protein [Streptomyces sp. NRRL F-5630]|uniref:hypothetical protein n=1 Tax=Streptomyces sp. NRRL F-5630 TaxID=1463864 RepID=UPI003D75233C
MARFSVAGGKSKIVSGVLLSCILVGGGLGIAAWQGAFAEGRGDIGAGDVCPNVSPRENVAEIFHSVLPKYSSYSFSSRVEPGRDLFASWCDVYGGKGKGRKYLVSFYAHPTATDSWIEVRDGEIVQGEYGEGLEPFAAGARAWVGPRMAVIGMTCWKKKTAKPEMNRLVATVTAKMPLATEHDKSVSALKKLAIGFAREVHREAKCEWPSRLPEG